MQKTPMQKTPMQKTPMQKTPMQKTPMQKSDKNQKTVSKLTILFCTIILSYFVFIKKDYDNPIIAFVIIYILLEGLYYFWRFYKKHDTL